MARIQTLQLVLAFGKEKSRILPKKLAAINSKVAQGALTTDGEREAKMMKEFEQGVEGELADKKMSNFAYKTGLNYSNAWWIHYCGFVPNNRVLPKGFALEIYDSIRISFPLHYMVFHSLIFSKGTHKLAQHIINGYASKQRTLVNHFAHWCGQGIRPICCIG